MWSVVRRKTAEQWAVPCARRRLWVAAASDNPSLAAAVSKCVDDIRSAVSDRAHSRPALRDRPGAGQQPRDVCFALVSQAYTGAHVAGLADEIARRLREAGFAAHIVGTVVDQVLDGSGRSGACGLSVLYYHAEGGLQALPFYVGDQHGRQRLREAAVGRWHNETTDRFDAHKARTRWVAGESSVTRAASHVELPPELTAGISDPEAVQLVLFASDRESRQVVDALDARFPGAVKLGIVGSQTPFLNGREYTLLAGDQTYSSGVLGFAFVAPGGRHAQERGISGPPGVTCSGLEPISKVLKIERCKGNVVLELEDGAAVSSLISVLRARRLAGSSGDESDSRLYAKVSRTPNASGSGDESAVPLSEPTSVLLQVTGGSPAKGGLALDTLRDLAPGQYIQFFMSAPKAHGGLPQSASGAPAIDGLEIRFGACRDDSTCASDLAEPGSGSQMQSQQPVAQVFGGATDGGFVYGYRQPQQSSAPTLDAGSVFTGSVECSVPGCAIALGLKQRG